MMIAAEQGVGFRGIIEPVPAGIARPRWSVIIPTYNSATFLREALESVLVQDPGPEWMQIEVVDDCSEKDDPEAVVRVVAGDRVSFHRQPRNVGHVENFTTCIRRARGELLHLLHGDDLVLPGFYATLENGFDDPAVGMAYCRHVLIDSDGHWKSVGPLTQREAGVLENAAAFLAATQPIQPPAVVVRRAVYEDVGGFDRRLTACGEDWEMWVRIASRYLIWHNPATLAAYRMHPESLSTRSFQSGLNIRDLRTAMQIYAEYLPTEQQDPVLEKSQRLTAEWAISVAREMAQRGNADAALTQLWEGFRCSHSPFIVRRSLALLLRILASQGRNVLLRGRGTGGEAGLG